MSAPDVRTPGGNRASAENTESSAAIMATRGFPSKKDTVVAEVLARLLSGEKLTSLGGVREASTTRLSAVVYYLGVKYGWRILAADKAAGCRDGRVAWVSEYAMLSEAIDRAMAAGAAAWCADVRKARAARRAKAVYARAAAEKANADAARRKAWRPAPAAPQLDLFKAVCGVTP